MCSSDLAGITPEFLDVRSFEIDKGRFISKSDVKSARSYVVIGPDLQDEFFKNTSSSARSGGGDEADVRRAGLRAENENVRHRDAECV